MNNDGGRVKVERSGGDTVETQPSGPGGSSGGVGFCEIQQPCGWNYVGVAFVVAVLLLIWVRVYDVVSRSKS